MTEKSSNPISPLRLVSTSWNMSLSLLVEILQLIFGKKAFTSLRVILKNKIKICYYLYFLHCDTKKSGALNFTWVFVSSCAIVSRM